MNTRRPTNPSMTVFCTRGDGSEEEGSDEHTVHWEIENYREKVENYQVGECLKTEIFKIQEK